MTVRIYDSKLHQVVPLETRDEGLVAMYCCGPTVYNYIHIGNARTTVWFDFIRRYLSYRGYGVTYVMNYTDVDDKIIERARLEGIPVDGLTTKYTKAFEDDMAALNVRPADIVCRATDHLPDMVDAIEALVDKGDAYETEGDVFFAVESFPRYGELSGRSLDDMRTRERVEPHAGKRHPLDFALWKSAKEGEPSWHSPWGPGRPGWHIECSVMSTKYLGMGFDLHGGGSDLIFPHHENEIAQAESLAGTAPFVRHWLHAGLVQMEAEKMSKSIGNIVLAKDAIAGYSGEAVRYWALAGSYRSQATFSPAALEDAAASYERWRTFFSAAGHFLGDAMPQRKPMPKRAPGEEGEDRFVRRFVAAMDDDFNSAESFAAVHELVREGHKALEQAQVEGRRSDPRLVSLVEVFLELTDILGFDFETAPEGSDELVGPLVGYLLELREQARSQGAFERADDIRARLTELGIVVEDTPTGPRWRAGGPG